MPKQALQQFLLNSQSPLTNLNAILEPQTYLQFQIPSKDTSTIPKGTTTQAIVNSTSINTTSTNTTIPATLDQSRQPPNISLVSSTCFILIGGALVCMAVLSFYSTGTLGTWYKGLKSVFGKKPRWLQQTPCTPQKEKVSPHPRTHRYSDGLCKKNHAHGDGGFKVAGTGVGVVLGAMMALVMKWVSMVVGLGCLRGGRGDRVVLGRREVEMKKRWSWGIGMQRVN